MSSLLPNYIPVTSHFCSVYQLTQYSAITLINQFESWYLQLHVPIAESYNISK